MRDFMEEFGWPMTIISVGLGLLLAIIFTPIYAISYQVDKGRCSSWGAAANRDTKFVWLNDLGPLPVTWDCFTPDQNGRWIPTSRVRDFD